MRPQQIIAHYRITAKLGQGGMGEVWRATDTKLGRDVAIKILPESFAAAPDRLARFTREAQVLASLNHPNIAAIYGVEEGALVMELVEGPTLAEQIAQGPVAVEEALPILKQIADALEYAHEHGIVHRDLKPANVKITPEGRVKVLDFGLAKAIATEAPAADPASSPTLTMRSTALGVIMGTAAYMSPEQAKGKPVDRRGDIWAFGVVLMEMLTGRPLYTGETVSEVLASVIRDQPDIGRMPVGIPARIRRLTRRCLDKNPQDRLRDIGEARVAIDEVMAGGDAEEAAPVRRRAMPWAAVAGVLALALIGVSFLFWRSMRPAEHPLVRLNVDLGPGAVEGPLITTAISPDGTRLAFVARNAAGKEFLATRRLDQANAVPLAGTEGVRDPFFSPDGQWIGFFTGGKMKKISVEGGAPVTLCDANSFSQRGAAWGEDGSIIVALNAAGGLWRVPSTGGTARTLTQPGDKGEAVHRWPQILPGGETVLFTGNSVVVGHENASIEVLSLRTGRWKVVQRGGYFGRYLPSGHLVYVHEGTLFAVAFDLDRLEARGTPVPVLEDVAGIANLGAGQFDFARNGTLVYLSAKSSRRVWPIVWLDRTGKTEQLLAADHYYTPRVSPDGQRLALATGTGGLNIHVYDWVRATMSQLTFTALLNSDPAWTPDGKHIAFSAQGPGSNRIQWIRSDGAGEERTLLERKTQVRPGSFSPDGRRLAFTELTPDTGTDIWTLPLDTSDAEHPKPGRPELFLRTPAMEREPAFSPDGRWMAYSSDESGRLDVYVRPFPPGQGGKYQISSAGGWLPIWSPNGRELFFESLDSHIMVSGYAAKGDSFVPEKPRLWCDTALVNAPLQSNLDLAPGGERFAALGAQETQGAGKSTVHVTFLLNFFDYLRQRVPAGGK